MSLDPYHFHMVLRQEAMTSAERISAEAQAARIAWELQRLVSAAGRAIVALRRAARPHGREHQRVAMRPRNS
jgi:hypothetical protein